jgi:CRP/FNR family transcriptional regulator, cyclic AMP receptor protein
MATNENTGKPASKLSVQDKKTALRIFWGQLRKSDRENVDADKIKFLKRIPFFENLKKNQLEHVSQMVYERDYRENEFIFEAGQPGAALFIVQSGEISVEIQHETEESTQLAVLGKHAFFGELALLDESPRSASARALVPTKVFALFRKDLAHLAETHPDISSQIYSTLALIIGNRLKATNELIEKRMKVVA